MTDSPGAAQALLVTDIMPLVVPAFGADDKLLGRLAHLTASARAASVPVIYGRVAFRAAIRTSPPATCFSSARRASWTSARITGPPASVPFRGTKRSGFRRELGRSEMDQFANVKTYGIACVRKDAMKPGLHLGYRTAQPPVDARDKMLEVDKRGSRQPGPS